MTSAVGLCRLSVRANDSAVDIAVPADVPLADLLPTIISYAGANLEEDGVEHGGWVLQRLGGDPLDEESTPEALGLHDGETLYLRPEHDTLPPVRFDDLVDGVASSLASRSDSWNPDMSRRMLLAVALAAICAAFAAVVMPGLGDLRSYAAGAIAALLVMAAGASSRAVGDATVATALAIAAVPFATVSGWLVPSGVNEAELLGARLLAGGAAAAGFAVLALAVVATTAPVFVGLGLVGGVCSVGGLMAALGLPLPFAASIIAAVTVIGGSFVPALSFRLSGLRLPPLPTNAGELQEGIDPYPNRTVVVRSEMADGYMTGLYGAIGIIFTGCLACLLSAGAWDDTLLAGVLSGLLVLHSRAMGSLLQRISVLSPGVLGLATLVLGLIGPLSPVGRIGVLVGLMAAAGVAVVVSWTVPGRRLAPYWGRVADLLHSLLALSVLSLVLLVLGVFGVLRAISG